MEEINQLRQDLRSYHNDVKRRLDLVENVQHEHHVAIHGIAGDESVPGLNVEVQSLRGFRERVRLGIGAAWAAVLTLASVMLSKR